MEPVVGWDDWVGQGDADEEDGMVDRKEMQERECKREEQWKFGKKKERGLPFMNLVSCY